MVYEEYALSKINNLLKDENALKNIKEIKEQLIKEKSTLDFKLKSVSDKNRDSVNSGLQELDESQKYVKRLKKQITEMTKLSQESTKSIERYDVIKRITKLQTMMEQTSSIYEKIVQFEDLVNNVIVMLDKEFENNQNDTLATGVPQLLEIHHQLTVARDFSEQCDILGQISSDDVQNHLPRIFRNLENATTKFNQLFQLIINDLLELLATKNYSLIVRFFKILEFEEKEDLRIQAIRTIVCLRERELEASKIKKISDSDSDMGVPVSTPANNAYKRTSKIKDRLLKMKNDEDQQDFGNQPKTATSNAAVQPAAEEDDYNTPSDKALAEEILNGTITSRVYPRNYKKMFLNYLSEEIDLVFKRCWDHFVQEEQNMFEILNGLDWINGELFAIKRFFPLYCPASLPIFHIYFQIYFKNLNKIFTDLVNSEPETSMILNILDFDKEFFRFLNKELGCSKQEIDGATSLLGDAAKQQLLDDYLNLILQKMQEWINNLEQSEFEIFEQRKQPPQSDSENLLYLDSTKTCFQMFTQQVEVAADSGQVKILLGVVESFCKLLVDRQNKWMTLINSEVKHWLDYTHQLETNPVLATMNKQEQAEYIAQNNSSDAAKLVTPSNGGLIEYLIAVANDQMKAADYAVAISTKFGELVSKSNSRIINDHIEGTLDGFASVAKTNTNGLLCIIFDDLVIPYKEIFSKSWYTGNQAHQISDTLNEYLTDIKGQMNPYVFSTFIENVIETTLLHYLNALKYGHSIKNKNGKFVDKLQDDASNFFKMFCEHVEPEEIQSIVSEKFKIMEFFLELCVHPLSDIAKIWTQVLAKYHDCPMSLLSAILKCRKDVDSSLSKQIMSQCLTITNERSKQVAAEMDMGPTFLNEFNLN
ncbi:hypothetical protein ACO0QE_004390 [Hanseniaspora vineae]